MGGPVAGGSGRISSLTLSFLSFTSSQVAHGKDFPGSAGERVEAAPSREPAPPQQGMKTRHKHPNQSRNNLSATTRDAAHTPLLRHRPPKTNWIMLDRKVRGEKGRGVPIFFSFFSFLPLFCRVWDVGGFMSCRVLPLSFCFPPLLEGALGKTPRPQDGGDPHPGVSRCPASPHPRRAVADPHQPEPLLSPSENTDARSSARAEDGGGSLPIRRRASPPTPPPAAAPRPPPRDGAELRLCRPWRWLGCKRPHGRRPATAKNALKKKKKAIYVAASRWKSAAPSLSPAGRHWGREKGKSRARGMTNPKLPAEHREPGLSHRPTGSPRGQAAQAVGRRTDLAGRWGPGR